MTQGGAGSVSPHGRLVHRATLSLPPELRILQAQAEPGVAHAWPADATTIWGVAPAKYLDLLKATIDKTMETGTAVDHHVSIVDGVAHPRETIWRRHGDTLTLTTYERDRPPEFVSEPDTVRREPAGSATVTPFSHESMFTAKGRLVYRCTITLPPDLLIVAQEIHSTAVNEQPSVGQRISDNVPPGGQQAIEELSGRVMSHGHAVLNYTSVVNGVAYDRQAVWTREGDKIEVACYDLTATVRVASVQNAVIKREPRVLTIPTQDTK